MGQILVINNKGQYNHRIQRSLSYLDIPSELVDNTLTVDEILEKEPNGLILGGGPSAEGSGNTVKYIENIEVPILGICLGHQLIAKAYGGEVTSSDTESYAQVNINILNEKDLFKGLSPNMDVWSSHKDEIKVLPEEFEIIANSNLCEIEAIKHKKLNIYGIQFHPEVHTTPKGDVIFNNFYNICRESEK